MAISDASPDGSRQPPGGQHGPFVAIGLTDALARELAGSRAVTSLLPAEIADAGLHRLDNVEICCLLMGGSVDALDIIADLLAAGYRGSVTVIAPPLPSPRMVEQELKAAASPLTVTLLVR